MNVSWHVDIDVCNRFRFVTAIYTSLAYVSWASVICHSGFEAEVTEFLSLVYLMFIIWVSVGY